jgi:hypothetical protein
MRRQLSLGESEERRVRSNSWLQGGNPGRRILKLGTMNALRWFLPYDENNQATVVRL